MKFNRIVTQFLEPRPAGTRIPLLLCGLALLVTVEKASAQGILGSNLILNGDAESGAAGTTTAAVASIPNWTRATGNANVLPYTIVGYLVSTDPAPPTHGFNYFAGDPKAGGASSLTQDIDVSSGASSINGGNVKFTASVYLGSAKGTGLAPTSQMAVAFKNAGGQTFTTVTVGPLGYNGDGLQFQEQIGLVPSGTVTITVTLTLNSGCENAAECAWGAADNLSLILNTLGTTPGTVLGANQVVNGGAEAGPGVVHTATTAYIPGWATENGASVAPYGGTNWIQTTDPGPADRGVNLFVGPGSMYQDLDVSAAGTLIDAGQVTYNVSAWLGSLAGTVAPTLTYTFYNWAGTQLAPTAQLGPPTKTGTALIETNFSGTLPAGTRRVHIVVTFPGDDSMADDINFTLAAPGGPPVISPSPGVVSAGAYGAFTSIAPGSWIEIYGTYLTSSPLRGNCAGFAGSCWATTDFSNGVAPTSLDGVTVSIGGQLAFIDYTSPGQINAQVPSNAPTGSVLVTVSNANGTSDGFPIIVNPTEPGLLAPPAFTISGKQYVAALFSDGATYAIPTNAISGVPSRPAHVGETVTIYGIGFGPVTGGITAGEIVPQTNSLTATMAIEFGTTQAIPSYDGLVPSFVGLYQFNVTVPTVTPNNAEPLSFTLGGTKGTQTLYIAVQN
jgi:uncharacterized protein (TIGR03437 family)